MIGLRCAVIVLVPLALSACVVPDASKADSAWAPKGINAANLAAMVEKPADLSHGRGDPGPDRKISARAVVDLWTNPTIAAALPGASAAGGGSSGGSQSPSASGAASGGGSGSGSGSASTGSGS
jgi:uncharacterized membrane protein YgcG